MRGNEGFRGRRAGLLVAVLATLAAALWLAGAGASAPTGVPVPASVTLEGWDTVSSSWTTGNTVQYKEGQAIPFRLDVSGLTAGTPYLATVCHEFVRSGVYGFLWLESYDSDVTPGTIGGSESDDLGPFTGVNVDLLDVEVTGAQGSCGSGERQVLVSFEVTDSTAYLLWGGHLAAPLDAIPGGGTVGYEQSAGWNVGSSLAMRLEEPDKTVPIPPGKIIRLSKIDVAKVVEGGTAQPGDFCFTISPNPAGQSQVCGSGSFLALETGTYTVTESGPAGYALQSVTGTNCSLLSAANGTASASVQASDNTPVTASCTFTNVARAQPVLIVKKVVVNDNGGTKAAKDFSFSVNGAAAVAFEADGENELTVAAGSYGVTEPAVPGYAATYSSDCSGTIDYDQTKTCTITNDDRPGRLIVKKVVKNDDGGTRKAESFSFSVNGGAAVAFEADGQNELAVNAGTYSVVETAAAGYTTSYVGCSNVVIPIGGSATCTITNDDQPGRLIVKKVVVNDEGGTKRAQDFSFRVNGAAATPFDADGQNELTVAAGTYTVAEPAVAGYAASYAGCANVVIPNGGTATCTITNDDDIPPTVELEKTVDPTSLPEPGGQFTFTLVVRNLSAEAVTITSLTDDVYGDLLASNPASDCDELDGWELAAAGAAGNADEVTCSFTVVLTGKQAGFSETDTVTVGVVDDEKDTAEAKDSATLEITDVPSSINVIKTANPTAMQEPGGPVTFSVVVQNTSATDAVTIDSLVDSIHGDLDGQGTCAAPQTIAAGGSYSCSFTVTVSATETDVVTASGTDDDGAEVSDSDDATVTITPTPPPPPRNDRIDIEVVKDATAQVTLGSNGTATIAYSALVRNNGPNMANSVTFADAAPSGVVFGAITKQPDFGSCSITPAVLTCNLGTMGYGVQTLITWTATVNVTGTIVNTATATGSGGAETNPGNNTDTATTLVVAPPVTPTPKPKPKPPVLKPPTKQPVAICKTLTVRQKLLQATGAKQRIRATVTEKLGKRSKPIAGARILIVGPGLRLSVLTNKKGVAVATIAPKRAGIIRLSISNKKPCNTQRIGVVGVFEPPVTG